MASIPLLSSEAISAVLATADLRCPHCRYALKANPSATCPECGRAIVIVVSSAPALTRLWSVGIVGSAACLSGLVALLLPLYFDARAAGWPLDGVLKDWLAPVGLLPLLLGLVFVISIGARSFMRWQSLPVQRVTAISLLVFSLLLTCWGTYQASQVPLQRSQALQQVFGTYLTLPF